MMIGDAAVGKTSILKWYDKRKINAAHIATSGLDQVTIMKTIDGNEFKVIFWDTAGQEKFRTLTYQYFKNADGIVIAFDLTSSESFNGVKEWLKQIYKNTQKG